MNAVWAGECIFKIIQHIWVDACIHFPYGAIDLQYVAPVKMKPVIFFAVLVSVPQSFTVPHDQNYTNATSPPPPPP